MPDLHVDARRDGDLGLVQVTGEARLEQVDSLRTAGRGLLAEGAKHLLVGLDGMGFADSASIGVLLEFDRDCRAKGGSLVLHGCSRRLLKIFEDMGLGGRFASASDEAAARRAAAAPR